MLKLFARVCFVLLLLLALPLAAQPLVKSATGLDPGNTKAVGATFSYRLTYNCSSTSGPCLNAQVVDLLPAQVSYVSTVPASPTTDVAAINVTNNYMGSGRTRVQFVMTTPLPAGNSGDLMIDVRFPNGSTPDGTVATNTADGINLGPSPGTMTTPPVVVTAVAAEQVTLTKTLQTSPANLDLPETYRLRIANGNVNGALNITAIGPVVDTLHPGTVFNGATPAADCQPGCVGTTPATVTWTSPCSLPLQPNQNCDISVNVTFPSATFPSGTSVTNQFTADGTPLGEPPVNFGIGSVTHPVTTFVPSPGIGLQKNVEGGSPNPPTLNQTFTYELIPSNNGNVPIDALVVTDTLPVEMQVTSVTTGAYNNLSDFAPGVGVRVSYEKNTALSVFTPWGSSTSAGTNTTLTAPPPGLGVGEYITRLRWEYGQAAVGMAASSNGNRPRVTGQIVNPDNTGGPVAIGDTIQNCINATAVYTAGPTNVSANNCRSFVLSGPFVQFNPQKENLSGGGPFNTGQIVSWRLRVRSDARSSDPVPLQYVVVTDLLPVDLTFGSWTFDDQGTGLPAPQTFDQIPNFAGTGRTLLRWRWNAGSGNLGVNQQVWINITTTIRDGAVSGNLANDVSIDSDAPGLQQRCSATNDADPLDVDGDGDTAESLCRARGTVTVAGIAQLVSTKTIQGTCDGGSVSVSSGTLIGGAIEYRLRVQNVGTVPMENFVLVDILPFVGDTGVRDTNPRGSLWTPLLAAPITPPPGTTIYYSTSGNPCRGEVSGPTTSCDPANWTTVAPTPITSVRSFKVEFGDRVLAPFDFLFFDFTMTAPAGITPGAPAYNSFAYQAERADGIGSLGAEPQKVGITLGSCDAASLGDYVWVDLNGDGIQNDGPTGMNGVYVQLFQPGVDGFAGTDDDVPLGSTITSNDSGGQPGWYLFPGLAPGNYFVRIVPPPTYEITTPDQGSDATDSDGNQVTGSSPVVALSANQQRLDVDFGLVATRLAALGNYVWFDRDSDGRQNEPVTDGVNGVTVRLYLDDGDGSPDAGDSLQATTVTANDVYGRPGYYLFDGIAPGLPHYVQFVLPASATGFTTANAGGDDTIDSEGPVSSAVTLAPDEVNLTLDAGLIAPSGTLALGDQVWADTDNDGVFEPENGEVGIDNVRLDLYRDVDSDGLPTIDEYAGTTTTATSGGFAGRYRFEDLAPGTYVVVVAPQNFDGGGALAGRSTSTGNDPAPDPDDDVNGDDNGTNFGDLTVSRPVTLSDNGEPTSEDGNNDTNLTVDFGFINTPPVNQEYDYGDAPDVGVGTARNNYNTTALDSGPYHRIAVSRTPRLGPCVDADNGLVQNAGANADDAVGSCTDDEDGVTFASVARIGATTQITITTTGTCVMNAWIDWDRNGVFGNTASEIILNNVSITGSSSISPVTPASAVPGVTYARFRCSTVGGDTPTGAAADGEVEDYTLAIVGTDFGDAPITYGSAVHEVDPTDPLTLGTCVDVETANQASIGALGDDSNVGTATFGSCFDDEDGVVFSTPVRTCTSTSLTVTASRAGRLDAWLDFNANGVFDSGEAIFTNIAVTAGANPLTFSTPCGAVAGPTYARFRISTTGGLTPTSNATDGEVEDYAVSVTSVDFGDAPDFYGTTIAANGASHTITPGFQLGATNDPEADGQPSVNADGDGAQDDGVTLPALLVRCSTSTLSVLFTNTTGIQGARIDGWIDFNRNGTFDAAENVAAQLLVVGVNNINFTVPCGAVSGTTYARFRLGDGPPTSATGDGGAGEVEDYMVTVIGYDFGDAPDPTFPTLLASNGARHIILATNNPSLGGAPDPEVDGQANDGADEDGVTFSALLPSATATMTLTGGTTGGVVNCWLDFNRDGDWGDAGEQIATNVAVGNGATVPQTFTVPNVASQGTAWARCRMSTVSGLGITGEAADGEIEDHAVTIGSVDFGDAPDSYGTTLANNGPRHGIVTGFTLGATIDAEVDGQANDGADEDGVALPATLNTCATVNVPVTLTNTAGIATPQLDAWIDFDGDGVFQVGERIATGLALVSGSNSIPVAVPCSANTISTWARFRLTSTGVTLPHGAVNDGEIEDWPVELIGLDYGDAPDPTFPTLRASNGARHRVLPTNNPSLGISPDTEADGQANDGADEDGVVFPQILIPGVTGTIELRGGAIGGITSCWIDLNQDGDWGDAGEQVVTDLALGAGAVSSQTFPVPVGVPSGTANVRCRMATLGGLGITGEAPDGEIEDHVVAVGTEAPEIGTALRVVTNTPDTTAQGWHFVTFELRVENIGNVPLTNVCLSLPLQSVFSPTAIYTVISLTSPTLTMNPTYNGNGINGMLGTGNTLQPGASGIVTLVLRVNPGSYTGQYVFSAVGCGDSPAGVNVTDVSQDGPSVDVDADGESVDDNVPTVIQFAIISIPTLGTWALIAMVGLLAFFAVRRS